MNLINSINVMMEGGQQILVAFSKPHTNKQAMERAKSTILTESSKGREVTAVRRCPESYGTNMWAAYHGLEFLGWITLNEITIPG